jgi:hypothetical protein
MLFYDGVSQCLNAVCLDFLYKIQENVQSPCEYLSLQDIFTFFVT